MNDPERKTIDEQRRNGNTPHLTLCSELRLRSSWRVVGLRPPKGRGGVRGGKAGTNTRFCETNPIYSGSETEFILQGYKVLEILKVVKIFGFVLENEPNLRGF